MVDLFTEADLAARMKIAAADLNTATAAGAQRSASGWLRSATGLTEWPVPVPDDLWGWALDLAVMVYANPEGLEEDQVGGTRSRYGLIRLKIDQILEAARSAYNRSGSPMATFPAAQGWPDPPIVQVIVRQ